MQKNRFFIYNKDKFSVVIKKGEKVIKEKIFSFNQGDEILNYFLENGAKLKENKGKFFLSGSNCFYYRFGKEVELQTNKGVVKPLASDCEYLFSANSGFIDGVELGNLTPVYKAVGIDGIKNARDIVTVWDYLKNQTISDELLKKIASDCFLLIEKNNDFYDKYFSWDMFRLTNNLELICDYENSEEKYTILKTVIVKFLDRVKNNSDKEKDIRYFMVFQAVERRLLSKEKNLYSLFGCEDKRLLFEHFYSKQICTAIFWVVNGRKIVFPFWYPKATFLEKKTGIVDCELSHYDFWRRCESEYPNSDFATFPRGRIMFDLDKKENVIFYDECITKEQLNEILELLQIKKYRIEYDEHYSCDNCVDKKELF